MNRMPSFPQTTTSEEEKKEGERSYNLEKKMYLAIMNCLPNFPKPTTSQEEEEEEEVSSFSYFNVPSTAHPHLRTGGGRS